MSYFNKPSNTKLAASLLASAITVSDNHILKPFSTPYDVNPILDIISKDHFIKYHLVKNPTSVVIAYGDYHSNRDSDIADLANKLSGIGINLVCSESYVGKYGTSSMTQSDLIWQGNESGFIVSLFSSVDATSKNNNLLLYGVDNITLRDLSFWLTVTRRSEAELQIEEYKMLQNEQSDHLLGTEDPTYVSYLRDSWSNGIEIIGDLLEKYTGSRPSPEELHDSYFRSTLYDQYAILERSKQAVASTINTLKKENRNSALVVYGQGHMAQIVDYFNRNNVSVIEVYK